MRMRFKPLALAILATLSAYADKVHDLFSANREAIIANGLFEAEGYVFAAGESGYTRIGGTASGYSKATMLAKSRFFDRNITSVEWPEDVSEPEKKEAWANVRMGKCEQMNLTGMQRVCSEKSSDNICRIVLAVEACQLDLLPKPSKEELAAAITQIRKKEARRSSIVKESVANEASLQEGASTESAVNQSTPTNTPNNFKVNDGFDAGMML